VNVLRDRRWKQPPLDFSGSRRRDRVLRWVVRRGIGRSLVLVALAPFGLVLAPVLLVALGIAAIHCATHPMGKRWGSGGER
jgi:hypothetical protein